MIIFYRISDAGYKKTKPNYITNENCLRNFCGVFQNSTNVIHVIADNVSAETKHMMDKYDKYIHGLEYVSIGHGAGTFNLALDRALKLSGDDIVYFVENDYIHRPEANRVLLEGFNTGAHYVTLYDHPDKYIDGINPFVHGRGEETKVYLSDSCHWKLTNSTTMTFATTLNTLREDQDILRSYIIGTYPHDFEMFCVLRAKGRLLVSSIPGYATHGETRWLAPLTDWSRIAKNEERK